MQEDQKGEWYCRYRGPFLESPDNLLFEPKALF